MTVVGIVPFLFPRCQTSARCIIRDVSKNSYIIVFMLLIKYGYLFLKGIVLIRFAILMGNGVFYNGSVSYSGSIRGRSVL